MGITIDTSTLCQDIADAVVECCHDLICNCCCGGVTPIPPIMDIEAATVSFRANVKEAFYVKKEGVIGIDQSKLLVYLKKYPNLVR